MSHVFFIRNRQMFVQFFLFISDEYLSRISFKVIVTNICLMIYASMTNMGPVFLLCFNDKYMSRDFFLN